MQSSWPNTSLRPSLGATVLALVSALGCTGLVEPPSEPIPATEAPHAPPPPDPAPLEPLRIGMSGSYMPLHEMADGEARGFEADLGRKVADSLQREAVFVDIGALKMSTLEAVATGQVDLALNGLTPTPDRARKVTFTAPYLTLSYRMAGLAPEVDEAIVGPIAVSASLAEAAVHSTLPEVEVLKLRSSREAVAAVEEGRASGYVAEDIGLGKAVEGTKLVVYDRNFGQSPIAGAIPRGTDPEPFESGLSELDDLKKTWGLRDAPPVSLDEVLAGLPTAFMNLRDWEGRLVTYIWCDDAGNYAYRIDLEQRRVSRWVGRHHQNEMMESKGWDLLSASRNGDVYTLVTEEDPLVFTWPVDGDRNLASLAGGGFYATRYGVFPEAGDCSTY